MPHRLSATAYAEAIQLHQAFDRTKPSAPQDGDILEPIARWLLRDAGMPESLLPARESARREVVTRLLTVRPARPIPAEALALLDALFAREAARRPRVHPEDLPAGGPPPLTIDRTGLQLWRGDITTLAVDAIVNAANAELLGCFRPSHGCIDNAIHTAAGPRLREDCRRIVEIEGGPEPTATAKITRAYYLPSRFVLHTVGPIVPGGHVQADHHTALAQCYEACLDLAADMAVKSIALCAISTGVFGYPKAEAARVATNTVRGWLKGHPDVFDLIIFNVFTAEDEQAYADAGACA